MYVGIEKLLRLWVTDGLFSLNPRCCKDCKSEFKANQKPQSPLTSNEEIEILKVNPAKDVPTYYQRSRLDLSSSPMNLYFNMTGLIAGAQPRTSWIIYSRKPTSEEQKTIDNGIAVISKKNPSGEIPFVSADDVEGVEDQIAELSETNVVEEPAHVELNERKKASLFVQLLTSLGTHSNLSQGTGENGEDNLDQSQEPNDDNQHVGTGHINPHPVDPLATKPTVVRFSIKRSAPQPSSPPSKKPKATKKAKKAK
ncbi:uncharacterized protein MELLADRAFT_114217 [Melampsora larici-populina 98AG31]|uniref:Uncharacterized protein n=1 Tax=Melampsora larici-populina (strain 98AG31 / pathotype 3-4-7) TaxID=747676 RepID=F4SCN3_MELLP|nr:uncharacterized protein MELLADRAFT_114217 [Melampsora larici-populina 98AG31]EGF97588.1 hypothetical protein MELLADRAFT_114217 [Melampsora larici-populina 98AG31]